MFLLPLKHPSKRTKWVWKDDVDYNPVALIWGKLIKHEFPGFGGPSAPNNIETVPFPIEQVVHSY